MRKEAFANWLQQVRRQAPGTAASRAANCATVESAYGFDLDDLTGNTFAELLRKFEYSKADQRANRSAMHAVAIKGDQYNGTATLRSALKLYQDFSRPQER